MVDVTGTSEGQTAEMSRRMYPGDLRGIRREALSQAVLFLKGMSVDGDALVKTADAFYQFLIKTEDSNG